MAVASRKPFLLRVSPRVLAAIERLAAGELRSTNAQMEVLLREALSRRGVSLAENEPNDQPGTN